MNASFTVKGKIHLRKLSITENYFVEREKQFAQSRAEIVCGSADVVDGLMHFFTFRRAAAGAEQN